MSSSANMPDYGPQMELLHQALDEWVPRELIVRKMTIQWCLTNFLHPYNHRVARLVMDHAPMMKEVSLELMDTIFVPRTVARQLAMAIALDTGLVTINSILAAIQSLLSNFSSRSRLIRQLKEKQENSHTQDEWIELALKIDNIQGNDV